MISHQKPLASQPEQDSVVALLDDVEGLVSPPDICLRLFELIHAPTTGAKDIADLVGMDPNLTARLLRIANSSFYSFSRKIDTISRAVTVVGTWRHSGGTACTPACWRGPWRSEPMYCTRSVCSCPV